MKRLTEIVPEAIKKPLRRPYRWLRHWPGRLRRAIEFYRNEHAPRLMLGDYGGFEIAYRKGTADENVLRESFANDIYFPGVPEYRPRPRDVIIDIGAHIGTFALLAAARAPQGKVYALEACRETCALLKINVALNRAANVDVTWLALAGRQGCATLYYAADGNWGHSITQRLSGQGEVVPTDTLGSFMRRKQLTRCDFMRLNCEGAEFAILLSSPREVLNCFEIMLVLYHCDLAEKHSAHDLQAHLHACGFSTAIRQATKHRGWLIAQQVSAKPAGAGASCH